MNSKQFIALAIVAFVGGIVGGFMSDQVGSIGQAYARGPQVPEKIEAKVIVAEDFKVIDKNGKAVASFGTFVTGNKDMDLYRSMGPTLKFNPDGGRGTTYNVHGMTK